MTGLILLAVIFSPFVVPALLTVVVSRGLLRRRERLEARNQIGRLGEGR